MEDYGEPRECPGCKFFRIPECIIVKKEGHQYKIFKCKLCGVKDIERHTPRMLWDGNRFVQERGDDEPYFDPKI